MRQKDWIGLAAIIILGAAIYLYRALYIEPRAWGGICAAATQPIACIPRAGLLWMQRQYGWGALALALGLWSFIWRGGYLIQLAAIILGIAAVANYNATWGTVGLALGAWSWLRRDSWKLDSRTP